MFAERIGIIPDAVTRLWPLCLYVSAFGFRADDGNGFPTKSISSSVTFDDVASGRTKHGGGAERALFFQWWSQQQSKKRSDVSSMLVHKLSPPTCAEILVVLLMIVSACANPSHLFIIQTKHLYLAKHDRELRIDYDAHHRVQQRHNNRFVYWCYIRLGLSNDRQHS